MIARIWKEIIVCKLISASTDYMVVHANYLPQHIMRFTERDKGASITNCLLYYMQNKQPEKYIHNLHSLSHKLSTKQALHDTTENYGH